MEKGWNWRYSATARELLDYFDNNRKITVLEYPLNEALKNILLKHGLTEQEIKKLSEYFPSGGQVRRRGRHGGLSDLFYMALARVFHEQGDLP